MKIKRKCVTILMMTLLMLTFMLATNANATEYLSVSWGHMLDTSTPAGEFSAEYHACEEVNYLMGGKSGWTSWNAYHTYTTSQTLNNTIDYRQANTVWAHDFWVGDFYPYLVSGTLHYNFYGHNGQNIHDYSLYTRTGATSKQHFSFIWTCACGNMFLDPHNYNYCYGYNDDINNTGRVGMPLAWTHRTDLSLNGYTNPDLTGYCYMGWNSTSLGMAVETGNPEYDTNYYFVEFFYEYLVAGNSINSALDYASNRIWGCTWQNPNNPLGYGTQFDGEWHWINVYGTGNMLLP